MKQETRAATAVKGVSGMSEASEVLLSGARLELVAAQPAVAPAAPKRQAQVLVARALHLGTAELQLRGLVEGA